MKLGDLVKWIGFPGASGPRGILDKGFGIGIIVAAYDIDGLERYDIAWHDGRIGTRIYPQCLEVVSESR